MDRVLTYVNVFSIVLCYSHNPSTFSYKSNLENLKIYPV